MGRTLWKILPWSLLLISALLSALSYQSLPERIATHFGIDGTPDGFSGKLLGVSLSPAISATALLLLEFFKGAEPLRKKKRVREFLDGEFPKIQSAFSFFFLILNSVIILNAKGIPVDVTRTVVASIGALLLFLSEPIGKAPRNYFFGVRTPWTLESDPVWERTHKLAGRIFAANGALLILSQGFPLTFSSLILTSISLVAYSYLCHRSLENGSRLVN